MADVSIADLGDAVAEAMREYTDGVKAAIPAVVDETARGALAELKSRSPKLTGSYAKGWRIKKTTSKRGEEGRIIYNATDYQLTHLLELGYAKRNGGRVSAIPHIAPIADQFKTRFTASLGRLIENGGK